MRIAIAPASRLVRAATLSLLIAAAAGCDRGGSAVPSEVARARHDAARRACAAAEAFRRSTDDVANLEETLATTGEGASAEMTRRAGTAALQFARAYAQHAQLRLGRYAHFDSAYNYSRRAADSVRHVQIAQELAIRTPEEETLEANVVRAYERDLRALLADPDHPCNWELEER